MIKAVEHVPGFVTGIEPNVADVATTAELLALPWVKQYEQAPDPAYSFHRWVQHHGHLMTEYNGGAVWFVVAYLSGDPVELPEWDEATALEIMRKRGP